MLYTQHIPCICIYLDISSPKSMVLHIEWVTTGAHNPAIQVWLELNCLEGVDVVSLPVWYEACLQNSIESRCTPGLGGVRSERYVQLFSIVVHDPLSQFLRKKLQHRMAGTVHVRNCLIWLAGSAACPDTLRNCCFSSIMSSAGAESCPWPSIYTVCQSGKWVLSISRSDMLCLLR